MITYLFFENEYESTQNPFPSLQVLF